MSPLSPTSLVRLVLLAAIWGGSYGLMRVVAPVFGGVGTAWSRIAIAGAALWLFVLALNAPLAMRRWWKQYLFIGFMNSALPFSLIAWGMKTLPAGYGAILNAAAPFFGALFASRMLGESMTPMRLIGMLLGVIGIALIVNLGPLPVNADVLLAVFACLAATVSYGFVIVYTKKYVHEAPNLGMATGSMLLPAVVLSPIGIAHLPTGVPSATVLVALVALALVCSGVAYILYFRLIRDIGPTRTIAVTFLVPVFGLIWGAVFFGERLTLGAALGSALVLSGLALVLGLVKWRGASAAP
jgi:drug/metabolite transporter (DMT)-like permease